MVRRLMELFFNLRSALILLSSATEAQSSRQPSASVTETESSLHPSAFVTETESSPQPFTGSVTEAVQRLPRKRRILQ